MSFRDEHRTPSAVLRKVKSPEKKDDKDDKKTDKAPRKNALLAFIADHKKSK